MVEGEREEREGGREEEEKGEGNYTKGVERGERNHNPTHTR